MDTENGKEGSMYGAISNLFTNSLGYSVRDVDIDSAGEDGRPDLAIKAESGLFDSKGRSKLTNWIVVEAKDERNAFTTSKNREKIFDEKAKYIGISTAWFVMVDPTVIVARPVHGRATSSGKDITLKLRKDLTEQGFQSVFQALHHNVSGVSKYLSKFREGDTALIATERLKNKGKGNQLTDRRIKVARKNFFRSLRFSISSLQDACRLALSSSKQEMETIISDANKFGKDWGGYTFDAHTLTITGNNQERDKVREHNRASALLKQRFSKSPSVSRLAMEGLPSFQQRTGCEDKVLDELFAIETANLILARVLLLRFFEDHGFFGDKRYICNGGVEAFQKMREYFDIGYTKLLKEAYKSASQLYANAFDKTELDWVIGINDKNLSNAIEWTLFQLSKYDFTTVRGDILTGIYDRFLDRKQRKALGEFYTPPSIAKYIVDKLEIDSESKVIDPACGSGTFLIEALQKKVGDDIERGVADYDDVLASFETINGNDLNVFSAVLSQIQLLWQILEFKNDIETKGFPSIHVTGKINSLVINDLMTTLDEFSIMDDKIYDAVIGNPPYVRAERSAQALDKHAEDYFKKGGISPKANAYTLFIYRALDSWCKAPNEDGSGAGKLGFIVPISLFDNKENKDLRRLFEIGGRWTIKEIVDLEVVWKSVFDAKTIPLIIIAEAKPASIQDIVTIRLGDRACVQIEEDAIRPILNIDELKEQQIPYENIFAPDGRILTRLTNKRMPIITKLRNNLTFGDIAKSYWVRKEKAKIVECTDQDPCDPSWEMKSMLSGGIAFRNHKPRCDAGFDVYKGENILACEIQGSPVETGINISALGKPNNSDASLWKHIDILPERGLAVAQISICPNGVSFDPKKVAFSNTVTIFFPRNELAKFPFDLLLLSNIYVYYYALYTRMGVLDAYRSHVYPANLKQLPWNDELARHTREIETLRDGIVDACEKVFNTKGKLNHAINNAGFKTLKQALKSRKQTRISWGHSFDMPDHVAEITKTSTNEEGDTIQVFLSQDLLDWVKINDKEVVDGLVKALKLYKGEGLKKSSLFNMCIPIDEVEHEKWDGLLQEYSLETAKSGMDIELNKLDRIVGESLGLDGADIDFIQKELREDPFLKKIKPRYPGKETRKQGFRTGLDSSERYK